MAGVGGCSRVMVMSPELLLAVITFRADGDCGTRTVAVPKLSRVVTRYAVAPAGSTSVMLPKLSVTFTRRGTLVNVREMSPELSLATTSAAASPVTEMVPKLSWSRVSPATPAAWMSPELLSSQMLPDRREAVSVPKLSAMWMCPVSPEALRSPVLSDSATVPRSPRAASSPNESLTLTGSPAGTVTPRLSEQNRGTRHSGLRLRPSGVDRWLNEGRTKLPLSCPRTSIREPVPV